MVFLTLVMLLFLLFARPIIGIFTNEPAVIEMAVLTLQIISVVYPFYAWGMMLTQAFNGAGDTVTPFLAAAAGNWVLRVPLAWLFAFVWHLDLVWVWYALLFDHLTRSVWLAWSFRRGRWRDARA